MTTTPTTEKTFTVRGYEAEALFSRIDSREVVVAFESGQEQVIRFPTARTIAGWVFCICRAARRRS